MYARRDRSYQTWRQGIDCHRRRLQRERAVLARAFERYETPRFRSRAEACCWRRGARFLEGVVTGVRQVTPSKMLDAQDWQRFRQAAQARSGKSEGQFAPNLDGRD